MARNGSGVYSLPEAAFVYNTVIDQAAVNSDFSDIALALTASIAADGQTTVTASLPLNSNKLTGLAVGSAATDSASLGQVQAEAYIWCGTMTGSANAGVLTPAPAITAYVAGQRFVWMASSNVNTGAMTVAISGLSTIAAQNDGSALAADDHAANKMYMGVLNTTSIMQIMRVRVSSPLVSDTSPQLGGALDPNGNFIGLDKGGDIASASPLVIDTDGDYFDVTGTTNYAAMTVAANRRFFLQFDGVLTMTHHATNLDLPGGNITTAAGDVGEFFSTGTNTVQCVNYTKADGTAVKIDANTVLDDENTTFTAAQRGSITTLTDGANISTNFALNNYFTVTLAGNRILDNPSNIVAGQSGSIFAIQDGSGSRTLSYGSFWDFPGGTAPTLTTTASAVDRLDYLVRTTTSIQAVLSGDVK